MANVLLILKRDIKRLIRTPSAWLVVIFICILPSLYTWFNVAAFWNPYDNTGNIEICIANEDAGATSELTGDLAVGDMIVEEMKGNNQLKWVFTGRDEAMEEVRSGRAYAALVIPESFSSDIVDLLEGDLEGPKIEYYVNEKAGPVAPKITDTASNLLDTKINDAFVSTVSGVIADAANKAGVDLQSGLLTARSELNRITAKARESLASVRDSLGSLASETDGAAGKVAALRQELGGLSGRISEASALLDEIAKGIGSVNSDLAGITSSLGNAIDGGTSKMSDALAGFDASLLNVANKASSAIGIADQALAYGEAAIQRGNEVSAEISRIIGRLPDGQLKSDATAALQALNERLAEEQAQLDQMTSLASSLQATVDSVNNAASQLNAGLQTAMASANAERTNIAQNLVPALGASLGNLSSQMAGLGASVGKQTTLVDQALKLLDSLSTTLGTVSATVTDTGGMLDGLVAEIDAISVDVSALSSSNLLASLFGKGEVDAEKVADFMESPTLIESEVLYPLAAYGSAMAPLFINLTLWIGVFMLMVVFRLESDDDDVPGATATQRYFGRLLLLAPIACMQAIVCCVGCVMLGVQTAGIAAFFITAIIASLSYLAIQYTLSTTFQIFGMGMCVVLVFVQIPGASGLYPVEMTTPFFQGVYPLFPFSYGINAIRETIAGFYGTAWLQYIGVLLLFLAVFVAIGVVVRPLLANTNRVIARQLRESELVNVESVMLPARRYRLSQIVQSVVDRNRYREAVERSHHRFEALYPRLKLFGLGGGIAVTVVVALIMALAGADKVSVITFWLLWFIAVIIYFIAVEVVRDSIAHRLSLETLNRDEAYDLYATRDTLSSVDEEIEGVAPEEEAGAVVFLDYGVGEDAPMELTDPGVFREEVDGDDGGDAR